MPKEWSKAIHSQVYEIIQSGYKFVEEETNCGNVADLKEVENRI
jgi:hypothetical protein